VCVHEPLREYVACPDVGVDAATVMLTADAIVEPGCTVPLKPLPVDAVHTWMLVPS
jgi:hypothetical protein